jgi:hypothetical protein
MVNTPVVHDDPTMMIIVLVVVFVGIVLIVDMWAAAIVTGALALAVAGVTLETVINWLIDDKVGQAVGIISAVALFNFIRKYGKKKGATT